MQAKEAVSLMRKLVMYGGVTHFVVTDEQFARLTTMQTENSQFLRDAGESVADNSEIIVFRGHRLLRQGDLQHLPFDPSPSTPDKFVGANS